MVTVPHKMVRLERCCIVEVSEKVPLTADNYQAVARLIVLVVKGSPKMAPTRLMTFGTRNLDIWSQRRFLSSKVSFTS